MLANIFSHIVFLSCSLCFYPEQLSKAKVFFYFNDIQFLNFYGSCFLVSIPPWHQENSPLAPCPKCFLCSFHKDFVALHLNHDTLWVAFLVAQVVKNPPAMWETWVWCWVGKIPLEMGMATHSSILAWRIPMDSGVWWTTVPGVAESDTTEWLSTAQQTSDSQRHLFFLPMPCGMWELSSLTRDRIHACCVRAWNLNHWIASGSP